jgi:transglutaminase-like putative cysteine protease
MKRTRRALTTFVAGWSVMTSLSLAEPHTDTQQTIYPEFQPPGETREFSIEYMGKVSEVPAGTKKLRVWMPAPQSTTVQKIDHLEFARLTSEQMRNQIAYWEFENPPTSLELRMQFVCARQEIRMDLERLKADGEDTRDAFDVYKNPDRLVLVDYEIRKISGEVVAGKTATLEKARAIYDYVLANMTYDKNHAGWGQGSTRHACDVGKGNCTDFHALFNSLCRAQGIASGFEIGLYLPYERNKVEPLGGYHCWAFFRVPGKTWVPVDCSEGDRFAERRYFSALHCQPRDAFDRTRHCTRAKAARRTAQLLPQPLRRGRRQVGENGKNLELPRPGLTKTLTHQKQTRETR